MAIIEFSGIGVTNSRNKEGNRILSYNQGGAYSKAYASPVVIPNDWGAAFREGYGLITGFWQTLQEFERQEWNEFAKTQRKINKVNSSYALSGFNCFMRQVLGVGFWGYLPSIIPQPPVKIIGLASLQFVGATPTAIVLNATNTDGSTQVPPDQICAFAATESISPGIMSRRNNIGLFYFAQPGENPTIADISTPYINQKGAPVPGKKIFVKVWMQSLITGLKSVPFTASTIVLP